MKKNLFAILTAIILFAGASSAQTFPFQDTALSVNERVEDLLSRLTLDEKLSMMEHRNPAIPSLGLPAYSWWNEALHGVGRNGLATVWPMPIALAATFNPQTVQRMFSLVSYEALLKFYQVRSADTCKSLFEPTDYTGMTFFTPNINIFRDPRWGRGMETYGEDPFLTAIMGLACVRGLQYEQPNGDREGLVAAACLKHLAVHSGPEALRHEFDAQVSPRDLWTTYLPAFEYIIKNSDVQQVMCGYNRLNGEPCCTNEHLLLDILRNKWKYDNIIVTDCWALNDCWERDTVIPRHKTHASAALTAGAAFGSEVDLECGSGLEALRTAVDSGLVSEEKVNEHVRRVLRTRMRTMMPLNVKQKSIIPVPAQQGELTPERMAASSLVLLKNAPASCLSKVKGKHLLPLAKGKTKIYLSGPNAVDTLMPLGNYNGTPAHTVNIREGLSELFTLVDNPRDADVIVYAGGLSPQLEGEELPVDMPGFYKGDRTRIELPDDQVKELHKLQRKHKPVILLLCSGSAIALDKTAQNCDAILACWYGGEAMGSAIAKSLAGEYDCFGRLPVTFYKSTAQLPDFSDYNMQGRTYRYMTEEPLYPFGYGLNYGKYHLEDVSYNAESMTVKGRIVTDRESPAGEMSQIVQVYLVGNNPQDPRKQLVGIAYCNNDFFSITLEPFWLRSFNETNGQMELPKPGTQLHLLVGLSSNDKDFIEIATEYSE